MNLIALKILLLLSAVCIGQPRHLSHTELAKLDMSFRTLLEKNLSQQDKESMRVSTSHDSCKKYGAIIYTQNPDTIEKMGIHLNSTVNSFVTAQITIDELIKLAKLKVVYAIRADRYEYPDSIHNPVKESEYSIDTMNTQIKKISEKPSCLKQSIQAGMSLKVRFEMCREKQPAKNPYPPEIQIKLNINKHLNLKLITPEKDTLRYSTTGWTQIKYSTIAMDLESCISDKVYKIKFLSPEYNKFKIPWSLILKNTQNTELDCTLLSDDFKFTLLNP